MKFILKVLLVGLFITLFCSSAFADKYTETKKMFEDAGVGDMFSSAHGYALFPTIGKAGFLIGGAYGKGRVYEKGMHIGNTEMFQATIGFQLGASGFSEVIFFKDKRALDEFTRGSFEFGADAQVTVITAAAQASANTSGSSATASGGKNNAAIANAGYNKGMAT
ncbi:MAG: lipid-binding SYLF domain-containing protein, partial [Deltaproteobacteria bacterium]|nr:lipid-binding SYLF domain-containing protein [Deltaproteobacteria bacterium]